MRTYTEIMIAFITRTTIQNIQITFYIHVFYAQTAFNLAFIFLKIFNIFLSLFKWRLLKIVLNKNIEI